MRILKIGTANLNNIVGGFRSNWQKMQEALETFHLQGCHFAVFQEGVLSGYPAEDLVLHEQFNISQLEILEEMKIFCQNKCPGMIVIFGMTYQLGSVYNVAVILQGTKIIGIVPKQNLPTYGVFYDGRTFAKWRAGAQEKVNGVSFGDLMFETPDFKFAVEICEDIWSVDGPSSRHCFEGAELIFNISASPFREGVFHSRQRLMEIRSSDNETTLVYVNAVGSNDSLVMDGGGFIAQNGTIQHEIPRWDGGARVYQIDLDFTKSSRASNTTWRQNAFDRERDCGKIKPVAVECKKPLTNWQKHLPLPGSGGFSNPGIFEDQIEAIIWGLDGYFQKSGAFERVVVSLSGGRDSVLTTLLAWMWAKRLGKDPKSMITCVSQPTRFNSEATKSIASNLCEGLDVNFIEESIEDGFSRELEALQNIAQTNVGDLPPIVKQNCQARLRALRMWNLSNSVNGLFLNTGCMSERAVGYSTIGGDIQGGYSLLGNLKKTQINALLEYFLNMDNIPEQVKPSLEILLQSAASAELAENQEDEKELMPFEILDRCYSLYAGEKMSPKDIWKTMCRIFADKYGEDQIEEWIKKFIKLFHRSIYKWIQTCESVHLQELDLDRERSLQLPSVSSLEWLNLDEKWSK